MYSCAMIEPSRGSYDRSLPHPLRADTTKRAPERSFPFYVGLRWLTAAACVLLLTVSVATPAGAAGLLIADGGENCMGDPVAVAKAIAGQPVPVPIHTIGFSSAAAPAALQPISAASAEGTHASALTGGALKGAMESVLKLLKSCAFDLAYPPKSADIHVFFNDQPQEIPESGLDGWTINPSGTAIAFHGKACDFITGGSVADVDVVEGCAAPTPD